MKFLFYLGCLLLLLFEVAHVYFIMPMPGSQEMESIDWAYFLHASRWWIRGAAFLLMIAGIRSAWKGSKVLTGFSIVLVGVILYMTNFKMSADHMFYQPRYLSFQPASNNKVERERLVMGVVWNDQAKAYPIQYLGYHHQVRDTVGGKPLMITYCTVCRTGRVFQPVVEGKPETFRLVGMDHFNAMFEDITTKTWWRQVTGEAIAGPLKGQSLPEFPFTQTSLETWLELYPHTLIMQPDTNFKEVYTSMDDYERGRPEGKLTRRDTASWQDKSWIVGMVLAEQSKAWDWNELADKRIIHDSIGTTPIVLVLSGDEKSLFAFIRSNPHQHMTFRNDTLTDGLVDYSLTGIAIDTAAPNLQQVQVYQEYWHSWRAFHPDTKR